MSRIAKDISEYSSMAFALFTAVSRMSAAAVRALSDAVSFEIISFSTDVSIPSESAAIAVSETSRIYLMAAGTISRLAISSMVSASMFTILQ